jgi:FAD-binding domain
MQRVHVCPAAEFFLNFPTVSLFQWHPFTVRHAMHGLER